MDVPRYVIRHDIGIVTTTGLFATNLPLSPIPSLAEGTTASSYVRTIGGTFQADIHVADGIASIFSTSTESAAQDETISLIHNPMMAFWKRAKLYYDNRNDLSQKGYPLLFDDCALIISDLGQSLSMLFGRHWNTIKEPYEKSIGTVPSRTPDLLFLIEKCYPLKGWNLPGELPTLHTHLVRFIEVYYKDLIKHFEYDKFLKGLQITPSDLGIFMEVCRQSWLWLVQKVFAKPFTPADPDFAEFTKEYAKLG